jgi:hypothetical protein
MLNNRLMGIRNGALALFIMDLATIAFETTELEPKRGLDLDLLLRNGVFPNDNGKYTPTNSLCSASYYITTDWVQISQLSSALLTIASLDSLLL